MHFFISGTDIEAIFRMDTYNYQIGKSRFHKAATFQQKATGNYLQCQIDSTTGQVNNLVTHTKLLNLRKWLNKNNIS